MATQEWPADSISRRDINELVPYARNARTHSVEQVDQIAASIREWGWTMPVLIDPEGGIIAGHGRVLAAQKLKLDTVPCMVADGWSDAQTRAYALADNKLAMNAGWDTEMLSFELKDLGYMDFSMSLIGFDEMELADLMAEKTEGLTDPDELPDLEPDAVISKPGDTWILGRHRLRCGDSTSAEDVAALCGDHPCDIVFTSPPYAQQRDYGTAAKAQVSDWDKLMMGVFSVLPIKDGANVLVNLGVVHADKQVNLYWNNWIDHMGAQKMPLFGWYVWDQGSGMPGANRGRLAASHEFIFHFSGSPSPSNKWVDKKPDSIVAAADVMKKASKSINRQKNGKQKPMYTPHASMQPTKIADSVIRINRAPAESAETGHPAIFPVALCEYIYKCFGKAGDLFYEPFAGSGTAIIACEKFGAACRGMEIDPIYTDAAIRRWQNFTGESAKRESDGEFFPSIRENG